MGYKGGLCYQLQLVDVFNQNVIHCRQDSRPQERSANPIDRIMEQLGSDSNLDVFRLVPKILNTLKGDVSPLSPFTVPKNFPNFYQLALGRGSNWHV